MNIPLSIVIPSITPRVGMFLYKLINELESQVQGCGERVEIISYLDNFQVSIGEKMNILDQLANGEYIAAIGDDDTIAHDYIRQLLRAIKENPGVDCVTFDIDIFVDGTRKMGTVTEGIGHGPDRSKWNKIPETGDKIMTHPPSDKAAIRRDIKLKVPTLDKSYGEDTEHAAALHEHLKTEVHIDRTLYIAMFRPNKEDGKQFKEKLDENRQEARATA